MFLEFVAPPGVDLKLESLETKSGIRLVAVRQEASREGAPSVEHATVFVPAGLLSHFFSRLEGYSNELTKKGHRKNRELVERIATIRLATIREFWTDEPGLFPGEQQSIWWEVWLRRDEGHELDRFDALALQANLTVGPRRLAFDDRVVCLVFATPTQLASSVEVLDDLAELRRAKDAAAFFVVLNAAEQGEWAQQLLDRLAPPAGDAPAVCLLDTGVTQGHQLIAPALSPEDASAAQADWGAHDHDGHGTEMAGLALYGDLAEVMQANEQVPLRHRLESVKILPPHGANHPDLYGAVTAEAVSRPEIQAPTRRRVFSMAITAPGAGDMGQPTSWSAALDALASGRMFAAGDRGLVYLDDANENAHRLFVVAAGNVRTFGADHLSLSDTESVEDPSHAWNALTVGASTNKALITSEDRDGWTPLAKGGDLSPFSRTGVSLQAKWPNKPDVVCEGGNVATSEGQFDEGVPELSLVSTFFRPLQKLFVLTNATSAATSQVSRMAAQALAEFPALWPETIRALVVQSARWTPLMAAQFSAAEKKSKIRPLLNRYGFGVPDVDRMLRSANDALTLIVESTIHPYQAGKTREMHIHCLPWPRQTLLDMGEAEVRLRVTLSYFVEPNPARRGWRAKHRYASHALRFDVRTADETLPQFRSRLNKQAKAEEGEPTQSDSDKWLLGSQLRHRGSLHSDIWVGTAAALAERESIGVYPVTGWWKEQPTRDRSDLGARYALIVSIETDAAGVDIWTPVAQQVGIPIEEIDIGT